MLSEPVGKVVVVYEAEPPLSVTVCRIFAPSLNVTLPVGVPEYCGETAAVNVTDCPKLEGFTEEVSAMVVAALLIAWLSAEDVLLAYVEPPL